VKFLVDAQLPRRMCSWLSSCGHDALHTLDLPQGNRTPDQALIERAELDGRILVTKDDDFVQSRLVRGRPRLDRDRQCRQSKAGIPNPHLVAVGGAGIRHQFVHRNGIGPAHHQGMRTGARPLAAASQWPPGLRWSRP
jgi:hypothetical protein